MLSFAVDPVAPSLRTYSRSKSVLASYFSLQLVAFLSLGVLLFTFLSNRAKRDGTISNLIAIFMAVSVGMSILFISGELTKPDEDFKFGVCLANAAIAIGTSSAQAVAALNVVLRIVIRIVASKGHLTAFCDSRALAIYLLASPWIAWIAFTIASLAVGLHDRSKVFKAVLYCSIDSESLLDAATIITAIITVITILLEITIAVILCRQFFDLRSFRKRSTAIPGQSSTRSSFKLGGASLPLIFRLGLFGLCVILALICAIVTQGDFTAFAGDFSIDAIGVAVFFIFGSQADVLRTWHLIPQSSTNTSRFNISSNNANTTTRGGGITVHTETIIMDSMPQLDLTRSGRDTDLDSINEMGEGESERGWGSQVALRKAEDEEEGTRGEEYKAHSDLKIKIKSPRQMKQQQKF